MRRLIFLLFLLLPQIAFAVGADSTRASLHVIKSGDTLIIRAGATIIFQYNTDARPDTVRGLARRVGRPWARFQVGADSLYTNWVDTTSASLVFGRANIQTNAVDSTKLLTGGSGSGFFTSWISKALNWTGVQAFSDGSASAPGITFWNDTNTGIIRLGPDSVAISVGGSSKVKAGADGVDLSIYGSTAAMKIQSTSSANAYINMQANADGGASTVGHGGYARELVVANGTTGRVRLSGNSGYAVIDSVGRFAIINGAVAFTVVPAAQLDVVNGASYSRVNAGDANWTASSDSTMKNNIVYLNPGTLDILKKFRDLPVVKYTWKPPADTLASDARYNNPHIGLLSQLWYPIGQLLGSTASRKEIDWQYVTMAQILAIKQLDSIVRAQQATIDSLRKGLLP